MQSFQRQFGKLGKRSADGQHISVLLKDFEEADQLLSRIIDASKQWRESWISILSYQHRLFAEFESLYQPIIGAGPDYQGGHDALETPEKTLARTSRITAECEELKRDLSDDLNQVDGQMIRPAQEAKDSLQTMRKTIKRREDKKLDFERYQSRFESSNKKSKTSDRDRIVAAKAQSDLTIATEAYHSADDHLRQCLPPILTSVFSLLPHILTAQIQIQNTLLGHYYTSIHGYCSQEGFPNPAPPMDEVIRIWSDTFLSTQHEAESISFLASGKAVRLPMKLEPNGHHFTNGNRRPSYNSLSQRGKSVSPSRALPPSPSYDNKSRIASSPSPSSISLLSPAETPMTYSSSPSLSAYQTPASVSTGPAYAPAGPNVDYFTRDRQPSANSINHPSSSIYHQLTAPTNGNITPSSLAGLAATKKKPPPPPPRLNSQQVQVQIVTALYDFSAGDSGDLSFREGDRIKVVKATESKDDWWQGESVRTGEKGQFPANYCS